MSINLTKKSLQIGQIEELIHTRKNTTFANALMYFYSSEVALTSCVEDFLDEVLSSLGSKEVAESHPPIQFALRKIVQGQFSSSDPEFDWQTLKTVCLAEQHPFREVVPALCGIASLLDVLEERRLKQDLDYKKHETLFFLEYRAKILLLKVMKMEQWPDDYPWKIWISDIDKENTHAPCSQGTDIFFKG